MTWRFNNSVASWDSNKSWIIILASQKPEKTSSKVEEAITRIFLVSRNFTIAEPEFFLENKDAHVR